VMLPETSYPVTTAFIISKSSPYKGFINWRWDNETKLNGCMMDRLFWVPCDVLKTETHFDVFLDPLY
jgi:hypothetical protein